MVNSKGHTPILTSELIFKIMLATFSLFSLFQYVSGRKNLQSSLDLLDNHQLRKNSQCNTFKNQFGIEPLKRPLGSLSPAVNPAVPSSAINHVFKCYIYMFFEHFQV